ncbi:MAG: hypothetical protein EXR65_00605 [Dehalococcoidia bacterium]|nr:hypothetical protein [Dehalococcoidia bacterium]
MAAHGEAAPGARRRSPLGLRLPPSALRGPLLVALAAVLGVGAVVWGSLAGPPGLQVFYFDAGPVDRLAIGKVEPYPELDFYVVGLADGRVRAVDGRLAGSGCAVRWLPDDARAVDHNPLRAPGAFEDPCSGALWAITGDAVAGGSRPLRTFAISYERDAAGVQHVFVEVLGRPSPAAAAGD